MHITFYYEIPEERKDLGYIDVNGTMVSINLKDITI
jgi:hypothetical protein